MSREKYSKEIKKLISTIESLELSEDFDRVVPAKLDLANKLGSIGDEMLEPYSAISLKLLTDIATHYMFAITISKTRKDEIVNKLKKIHAQILRIINPSLDEEKIKELSELDIDSLSHKTELLDLRIFTSSRLEEVNALMEGDQEDKYVEKSTALLDHISLKMKKYLQDFFKEARDILGPPPCEFSVIGLGIYGTKAVYSLF